MTWMGIRYMRSACAEKGTGPPGHAYVVMGQYRMWSCECGMRHAGCGHGVIQAGKRGGSRRGQDTIREDGVSRLCEESVKENNIAVEVLNLRDEDDEGQAKIEAQKRAAERNEKPKGSQIEARNAGLKTVCVVCKAPLANYKQLVDHYGSKHPKEGVPPAPSS